MGCVRARQIMATSWLSPSLANDHTHCRHRNKTEAKVVRAYLLVRGSSFCPELWALPASPSTASCGTTACRRGRWCADI